MFTFEKTGQRLIPSLHNDAFPHPLPKLRLRRPKLLSIATDHERCFLFAFFLLVRVHADTPLSLRNTRATHVPEREASLARQQRVVKPADAHSLPRSGKA